MSRPDSLVTILAVLFATLLVASAVVPVVSVATTPESAVATHQSSGSESLACGFAAGSTTADEDASRNVSLTTLVAPGTVYSELENASAIAAATDDGRVTPLDADEPRVATTDIAVHRIELNGSAVGLLDRLNAQDRGSPTENFQTLVQDEEVQFDYVGPTACPPELALNETIERGALRVVTDRENGTLYVLLDVDEGVYQRPGSSGEADDWDWGHHAISLELSKSSRLVTENVSVKNHYDADNPQAIFEAETEGLVRVSAESNQTIRGRTTVAPGTEIQVQLRSVEASTGRLNATATVNQSRGFDAQFDLSEVGDALYTVRIVSDTPNITIKGEPPKVRTVRTTTTQETTETRTATATTSTPTTETKVFIDTTTTTTTLTSPAVPGFGPIVGAVALLVSLLVLWRRQ